jgi:hypothetical protein
MIKISTTVEVGREQKVYEARKSDTCGHGAHAFDISPIIDAEVSGRASI